MTGPSWCGGGMGLRAFLLILMVLVPGGAAAKETPIPGGPEHPNVLMIAVDDLNHWVGYLDRNPQTRTPNIDRLAEMGVAFLHAYAPAPVCNPSRTALLSGLRPHVTGVYDNNTRFEAHIRPGLGIPAQFLDAGYDVFGAGKIHHNFRYFPEEWTEFNAKARRNKDGIGVRGGNGYGRKIVPGLRKRDFGDWDTVDWCIDKLQGGHHAPFFLACGLFKPHRAFNAPQTFHDRFPTEDVILPQVQQNDLDDVPPAALMAVSEDGRRDFGRFEQERRWTSIISNYLAVVSYADSNVGRLLKALEASPHAETTIVVLWGDHGWHFGEKQHFRKHTLWEEATRTPLVWYVPWLDRAGVRVETPVDLMSVYPTLMELAGLPRPAHVEDPSVAPLLADPEASWERPALMTMGAGNHAVRMGPWRLIRYADGSRELYDHRTDPLEWTNIAGDPDHAALIADLERWMPGD